MSTNITRKNEGPGGHKETGNFGSMAEKARETAGNLGEKARDTATGLAERARETAGNVAEKARETAGNVAERARDVASTIGHKADDAASAVGSGMKSLAETIRENAPHEGTIGKASSSVAGFLEHSARHLEEDGIASIGDELTKMIRRNPIPSLLVGIGIGFLLARATRS